MFIDVCHLELVRSNFSRRIDGRRVVLTNFVSPPSTHFIADGGRLDGHKLEKLTDGSAQPTIMTSAVRCSETPAVPNCVQCPQDSRPRIWSTLSRGNQIWRERSTSDSTIVFRTV